MKQRIMEAPSAVAVVTGASSGIGRALALRLGATGYRVGLIVRRRELIEAAASQIVAAGGQAAAAAADVGDRTALRGLRRDRSAVRPSSRHGRQRRPWCPDAARSLEHRRRRTDDSRQPDGCHLLDRGRVARDDRERAGICWPFRAWEPSRACRASRPIAPARPRSTPTWRACESRCALTASS